MSKPSKISYLGTYTNYDINAIKYKCEVSHAALVFKTRSPYPSLLRCQASVTHLAYGYIHTYILTSFIFLASIHQQDNKRFTID